MGALQAYQQDHPAAEIDIYRQNSVSIRIRIVDPTLAALSKVDRSRLVWKYFAALSEDLQSEISTLLLLTPEEIKLSFANFEFEDPIPSVL